MCEDSIRAASTMIPRLNFSSLMRVMSDIDRGWIFAAENSEQPLILAFIPKPQAHPSRHRAGQI
jgi:hypothetical protein